MTSPCLTSRGLRRPCSRAGFTLIEAIATIAVLGVVASVAASIMVSATTSWRDGAVSAEVHEELSAGLERIVKELRSIAPHETVSGAPEISSLTPTSVAYNQTSSLALSGDALMLIAEGEPPSPLLQGVTAISFTASDHQGAPLSASLSGPSCQAIRRVQITITIQRQGIQHTLRTAVFLRCAVSGTDS